MRKISNEAKTLITEIESELKKNLPKDGDFNQPIPAKVRQEWSDSMLSLITLIDNIIYLEQSYTMPHSLDELGQLSELTSERVRQVEQEAVKKICKNNTKKSLNELKEAVEEFSNAKNERMSDFGNDVEDPYVNPKDIDHNGKVKS